MEPETQTYASTLNQAAMPRATREEGEMDRLIARADQCAVRLDQTRGRIGAACDRLIGTEPTAEGSDCKEVIPSGQFGQLHHLLSRILAVASDLSGEADRLDRI